MSPIAVASSAPFLAGAFILALIAWRAGKRDSLLALAPPESDEKEETGEKRVGNHAFYEACGFTGGKRAFQLRLEA